MTTKAMVPARGTVIRASQSDSEILKSIDARGQEPTRDQWRAMVAEVERQRNHYEAEARRLRDALNAGQGARCIPNWRPWTHAAKDDAA